jgi:hypothetical protein
VDAFPGNPEIECCGNSLQLLLDQFAARQRTAGALLLEARQGGLLIPVRAALVEPAFRVRRSLRPVTGLGEENSGLDGAADAGKCGIEGYGTLEEMFGGVDDLFE